MTKRPVVRLATEQDVASVAALFQKCMPDSVWAELGQTACETYFRQHVESAYELLLVAEASGDVVGACLGNGSPRHLAKSDVCRAGAPTCGGAVPNCVAPPERFASVGPALGACGRSHRPWTRAVGIARRA